MTHPDEPYAKAVRRYVSTLTHGVCKDVFYTGILFLSQCPLKNQCSHTAMTRRFHIFVFCVLHPLLFEHFCNLLHFIRYCNMLRAAFFAFSAGNALRSLSHRPRVIFIIHALRGTVCIERYLFGIIQRKVIGYGDMFGQPSTQYRACRTGIAIARLIIFTTSRTAPFSFSESGSNRCI